MTINEVNQAMNNMHYYVTELKKTFIGLDADNASFDDLQCFTDLDIMAKLIDDCGNHIKNRLNKKPKLHIRFT